MRVWTITLCLLVASCTVGPDFTLPSPELPDFWHDHSAEVPAHEQGDITALADPDPSWWKGFNDPELNSLIDRAIDGNLNLQQAVYRIVEAREGVVSAGAAGLPHLNAQGEYMREQLGLRGLSKEFGGIPATTSSGGGFINQLYQPFNLFQTSLDASWELDLFGRVRRSVEQAEANTEAQIENRNGALVALEAEIATDYAQLRGAQALKQISDDDVKVEQDILDLTQRRYKQGLASYLDVDNAETQLGNTQAELPQFVQQQAVSANALAVLLGNPPGALDDELTIVQPVPSLPREIPIGLPSTLAERRPDIRQAAAELHAATAGLGLAIAQTWPDLSLTGQFGTRAAEGTYLTHWANHFYTGGGSVSLPIFQGGQLTANIDLSTAEQAEAAVGYQKAVLNGLQEVENALAAYRADRARQQSLRQTVASAEDGLYLAKNRYEHGLSNFIDVLTTENQLVTARQQLTDSVLAVTLDVTQLYKALGGGWQTDAPPPPTEAQTPDLAKVVEP